MPQTISCWTCPVCPVNRRLTADSHRSFSPCITPCSEHCLFVCLFVCLSILCRFRAPRSLVHSHHFSFDVFVYSMLQMKCIVMKTIKVVKLHFRCLIALHITLQALFQCFPPLLSSALGLWLRSGLGSTSVCRGPTIVPILFLGYALVEFDAFVLTSKVLLFFIAFSSPGL